MTQEEAYNYAGLRGMQLLRPNQAHMINAEKELEFVFQARAALEKQIPKKPKTVKVNKVFEVPAEVDSCPVCGYGPVWLKYCENCGQALEME